MYYRETFFRKKNIIVDLATYCPQSTVYYQCSPLWFLVIYKSEVGRPLLAGGCFIVHAGRPKCPARGC